MLLGRSTWQLFSRLWPGRDDPFAARMNAVPKLLTFPTVLGTGDRLFPAGRQPAYLRCQSTELAGAAVLTRYAREAR